MSYSSELVHIFVWITCRENLLVFVRLIEEQVWRVIFRLSDWRPSSVLRKIVWDAVSRLLIFVWITCRKNLLGFIGLITEQDCRVIFRLSDWRRSSVLRRIVWDAVRGLL